MCGGSESSSSSTRNTDNSRTDSRQAASGEAVTARDRARVTVERADAEVMSELIEEAGGWREFVGDAFMGAKDLMQDANEGLEKVATTTAKSDDLEGVQTIAKTVIPAAAVVAGAYILSR